MNRPGSGNIDIFARLQNDIARRIGNADILVRIDYPCTRSNHRSRGRATVPACISRKKSAASARHGSIQGNVVASEQPQLLVSSPSYCVYHSNVARSAACRIGGHHGHIGQTQLSLQLRNGEQ